MQGGAFVEKNDKIATEEREEPDYDITLGMTDDEMTRRFRKAVELANEYKKARGEPIARFDWNTRRPYLEYPDGRREYD